MKILLEIFILSAIGLLFINYVMTVLTEKQIIEDSDGVPYLHRYFIYRPDWAAKLGLDPKKLGRIYLHHIIRSDWDRALHDHPWTFRSFMLRGNYTEYTTLEDVAKNVKIAKPNPQKWDFVNWPFDRSTVKATFKAPCYIKRPATWRHRLELAEGKTTWTLVFIGPKVRSWGFWTTLNSWCHWKKYNYRTGLCEEPETLTRMIPEQPAEEVMG